MRLRSLRWCPWLRGSLHTSSCRTPTSSLLPDSTAPEGALLIWRIVTGEPGLTRMRTRAARGAAFHDGLREAFEGEVAE